MFKKILIFILVILALALSPSVFANHKDIPDVNSIPEKNGLYDDPDHKGLKVRVFVHPEKPTKVTASSLVCDLSDPDSIAVVSAAGWRLPANWTYNLNPGSVPTSVGSSNLATIVGNSFNDWTAASANKVIFARGTDTSATRSSYDSKNIIAWGRTSGNSLGVTYIRYYPSTGQVVDVDTIMNKRVAWKWSNSQTCAYSEAYDAENIMTHELGHWLSLDDEYDTAYQDATMYGYGSKGEVKKNSLTTGDTQGTFAIYNP